MPFTMCSAVTFHQMCFCDYEMMRYYNQIRLNSELLVLGLRCEKMFFMVTNQQVLKSLALVCLVLQPLPGGPQHSIIPETVSLRRFSVIQITVVLNALVEVNWPSSCS